MGKVDVLPCSQTCRPALHQIGTHAWGTEWDHQQRRCHGRNMKKKEIKQYQNHKSK